MEIHVRVSVANMYLVTWRNKIFQTLGQIFSRDNFQRTYHVILSYSSCARRFNFASRRRSDFQKIVSFPQLPFTFDSPVSTAREIINCFSSRDTRLLARGITFSVLRRGHRSRYSNHKLCALTPVSNDIQIPIFGNWLPLVNRTIFFSFRYFCEFYEYQK